MPHPQASRVLIVLFDGLRPDLVTPDRMPALSAFLADARRFTEASSVFPSLTRVCATTIATGQPPAVSGIIQNAFPDAAAQEGRFLNTASAEDMRRAARHHGPGFVATPRFADALAAAGRRFALVHSGSAGGAYLLDPRARANGSAVMSLAGREASETPELWDAVTARIGAPPVAADKVPLMDYAGKAMAEVVLPELRPDVALLWLTEPDWSFHYSGMDTPATRAALRASDDAFARVLAAAAALPQAERMAVIAMSDHGHVGTTEPFDLVGELDALGFQGTLDRPGEDLSIAAGTLCWLWPSVADAVRLGRLVAALREKAWCGALLAAGGNGIEGPWPGTFDLALLNVEHPRSAPLLLGMRGGPEPDRWGLAGNSPIVGKDFPLGGGMHGGLHRQEMANLIALRMAGVEAGEDAAPVGLIDIAPTLLSLLGVAPTAPMAGRSVLAGEAPRERRVLETGAGDYRQRIVLAGEGRGAIIRDGGRVG
ncbi:Predicted pyrophosphatase or phosphodiesterase, AlkP superfamily [Roseomonas rosea]|uniref:Predicted pyrophosphatase or phosphodiesterase, AlkP superfamily n=1 Tax=Muricoccus roseus TaxID=198092 RepID=A0A1M6D0H8_9PROT|nr:alkaline phosphatase family protein [Roseomonas rosea]SHI66574.1 Predicted pyrophosphatase or phosphodiesterase, AlkP superfamily [Roseomonas rosea]